MESIRLNSSPSAILPGSIQAPKNLKPYQFFTTNSLTTTKIYPTNCPVAKLSINVHPTNIRGAKISTNFFPKSQFRRRQEKIRPLVIKSAAAGEGGGLIGENPEWFESDYVAVGLAHCFTTINEKLRDFFVIEPIPSSGLECMYNGGVTSYKCVIGSTLGIVLKEDVNLLPEEFRVGVFAEKFERRAKAASRTWKREYPQGNLMHLAPVGGGVKKGFNFKVEEKRILGLVHEVKDEDNIKQDLSIDVYGRKKKNEGQGEKKEEEKLISALYNV